MGLNMEIDQKWVDIEKLPDNTISGIRKENLMIVII